MKHMTINGVVGKAHYWISRPNNNSKGALVFTHGLTADHTMYERQVAYFKNDYVVITWDVHFMDYLYLIRSFLMKLLQEI